MPEIELPPTLRMTDIMLSVFDIVHISHHEPVIKEKLLALVKAIEEKDKAATQWSQIMFKIANKIN